MIEEGRYEVGSRLPGQHELARQFGVSLTTMRAAIDILERDGFIRSEHGLGTYVTRPERRVQRALVVDDDSEAVALLQAVLEGEGAEVTGALSKAEALESVSSGKFDVIFLDLVMPDGSGGEIFAEFRRLAVPSPVVIVTGVTDAQVISDAMEHGPLTLIRKPVRINQVREVLRILQPARGLRGREGR
jgi:CheY-like chemotaxis protein